MGASFVLFYSVKSAFFLTFCMFGVISEPALAVNSVCFWYIYIYIKVCFWYIWHGKILNWLKKEKRKVVLKCQTFSSAQLPSSFLFCFGFFTSEDYMYIYIFSFFPSPPPPPPPPPLYGKILNWKKKKSGFKMPNIFLGTTACLGVLLFLQLKTIRNSGVRVSRGGPT